MGRILCPSHDDIVWGAHYHSAQNNLILLTYCSTAVANKGQGQTLNSQQTSHSLPVRGSYGVSFVSLNRIYVVRILDLLPKFHCHPFSKTMKLIFCASYVGGCRTFLLHNRYLEYLTDANRTPYMVFSVIMFYSYSGGWITAKFFTCHNSNVAVPLQFYTTKTVEFTVNII